jgi:hypothetical protein
METAKNMVVSLYPEWTDFNYHDPGITMLELFSWIKEGQQYFLDQIGTEHKKKYLKLLGMSPLHKKPAQALVTVTSANDHVVLKGTKLMAGNVCFEVEKTQCILDNNIIECFHGREQLEHVCDSRRLEKNETLRMFLLGENPQPGDVCYIGFRKEPKNNENLVIFIQLEERTEVKRNPIDTELFFPLLRLKYEYFSDGTWKEIEELTDTTFGMLQDGMISFCFHDNMELTEVFGRKAYYIRVRVEQSDVDVPPILEKIKLNVLPVVQKDTWVEHEEFIFEKKGEKCFARAGSFLSIEGKNDLYVEKDGIYYPIPVHEKMIDVETGEAEFIFDVPEHQGKRVMIVSYYEYPQMKKCIGIGSGFPYQAFDLQSKNFITEQVEVLVHEIGTGNGYRCWKRVEDFSSSKAEDRHFMIDDREGKIIFGDCEHGMAPEGEILLISFAETFGEEGNVKKGKINYFSHVQTEELTVWNEKDAMYGKDEESLEECFFRARKKLKHPDTAVTYADYERYVRETPGLMIESCKVISADDMRDIKGKWEENTISIVVKSFSENGKRELSQSYKRNILSYLERYRMLGSKIDIIAPRYIPLDICLDIMIKPHFNDAKERIQQVVEDYFKIMSEEFGATIVYSELYGIIDMLECVAGINEITLDVKDGKVVRTQDGNITLPPNGVVERKEVQYLLTLSD